MKTIIEPLYLFHPGIARRSRKNISFVFSSLVQVTENKGDIVFPTSIKRMIISIDPLRILQVSCNESVGFGGPKVRWMSRNRPQ
jgi:hypothetical protein